MIKIQNKIKGYDGEAFLAEEVPAGLHMKFENGNVISIQFGYGNYCDNKHLSKSECSNAEIAIWNADGKWYDFGGDEVKGYCSADEIAEWINFAANNKF